MLEAGWVKRTDSIELLLVNELIESASEVEGIKGNICSENKSSKMFYDFKKWINFYD